MPRLIILARHSSVRQVNIADALTTIGRSGSNRVCIDSQRVSRHHAAIQWTGKHFLITDMGSRNGTFVNDEKVYSQPLANGDAIMIGDCRIRFLHSSLEAPLVDDLRLLSEPAELELVQGDSMPQVSYAQAARAAPRGTARGWRSLINRAAS
jgi:pSer/pThr/pTyr-binding forkhead associated (FHA) protein